MINQFQAVAIARRLSTEFHLPLTSSINAVRSAVAIARRLSTEFYPITQGRRYYALGEKSQSPEGSQLNFTCVNNNQSTKKWRNLVAIARRLSTEFHLCRIPPELILIVCSVAIARRLSTEFHRCKMFDAYLNTQTENVAIARRLSTEFHLNLSFSSSFSQ